MKPFVKDLLELRGLAKKDVVKRVRHRQRYGHEPTYCVENAINEMNKTGNVTVCGWLVSPPEANDTCACALFHYWNYDTTTGNHYDTTPGFDRDHTYVVDWDLNDYAAGKKRFDWLPSVHFNKDKRFVAMPNWDPDSPYQQLNAEKNKTELGMDITGYKVLNNEILYDLMDMIRKYYKQSEPA